MKQCVECGRPFSTSRRCQVCGIEVEAHNEKIVNFCLLCPRCAHAIEQGLDLRQYREKKKERMKRCQDCIQYPS